MTKDTALLKLARLENAKGDPEQERQNLVEYFGRSPNASPDVLDALAAEYRQELIDTIERGA